MGEPYYPDESQIFPNTIEQEPRQNRDRKIALYKCILGHLIGIITAIAELHIGEKVRLRD